MVVCMLCIYRAVEKECTLRLEQLCLLNVTWCTCSGPPQLRRAKHHVEFLHLALRNHLQH